MTNYNYVFYAIAFIVCFILVHVIISLSDPSRYRENTAKEKFYTLSHLTSKTPYSKKVLFCSDASNFALTSSHLIIHIQQNESYNSKIISVSDIVSISHRGIIKLESDGENMSNVIVKEKYGVIHFLNLPTKEVESFMNAWENRPVASLSQIV